MKHVFLSKIEIIHSILERFFKLNYNRSSTPEILEGEDKDAFNLACRLYKRGFFNSKNNFPDSIPQQLKYIEIEENFNYNKKTFFIVDRNFIINHPIIKNYCSILATERNKNLNTVKNILMKIPENTESIFVIGGGITLDVGGFVAGLLNLPVHYLPTTLLSAVDAAVGGKTGVNFSPYGKNQVGLFYPATSLYFEPKFLTSLSLEEKLCGTVEATKHSYLFGSFQEDINLLRKIISNSIHTKELNHLVNKNLNYKLEVVRLDPQEKNGIRANLNFGHSLAHVLEGLSEEGYIEVIPHGIAVAYGIKFLFECGFISQNADILNFINEVIAISNRSIVLKKQLSMSAIISLLSQDKKNTSQEMCSLSLPQYGCFKEKSIKEFPISEISEKMMIFIQTEALPSVTSQKNI